ncbi:kunitz-type protease inhibitor 1-like isoform X2 [Sander lucioperca]|uniref:kunitz-type protease inhibitor 1-like isoform X2 n=1 Tax=Sander lucioperca TaxID=283035 RepID=UPI00125E75EE|nr:kunitz-type protease inhibitor 1-like isoform X2 [Sander lucioperca]
MPPPSSSSSLCLSLLLFLPLVRPAGAAEDAHCSAPFHPGPENFVLDAEDAVKEGAALLATAQVRSNKDCRRACCDDTRCNVALLEPRGAGADAAGAAAAENRTCVLFNCLHRNSFVCRFVNQEGYLSSVREAVFRQHLQGSQKAGESQTPLPAGKMSPPVAVAGPDVVVQPGETVTLSGIQSLALGDAHITKYQWSLERGDGHVTLKTELPDQVMLSNLQPGSYVLQLTVTDSKDQSDDAQVTVLVLSPELSSLYCMSEMKVGPCRASFPRWHYNTSTGSCHQFVFGGCVSNYNNFLSKDECLLACRAVTATSERKVTLPSTEVCGVDCSPDQLACDGCCLDRSLECDGVKQCKDGKDEEQCIKLNQSFNQLRNISFNQGQARCVEPPVTGPCRASHTRWYYDPLNRKCHRFTYGGCEGSENNFDKEHKCRDACKGVTEKNVFSRGLFERLETEDENDSGNIALAVCLSVAILALLAVLAYCILKNRKERSQRLTATSPAHVPLSEQETLVYNSTTKPV